MANASSRGGAYQGGNTMGNLSLFNIMLNLIHSSYTIHTWAIHHLYTIYAWAMEGATRIFLPNGLQTENLLFCLTLIFVVENQVIETATRKFFNVHRKQDEGIWPLWCQPNAALCSDWRAASFLKIRQLPINVSRRSQCRRGIRRHRLGQ